MAESMASAGAKHVSFRETAFSDLKTNFKEVLISPRSENIPKSTRLTIMTQGLILLVSLAFALVYTQAARVEICQAKSIGDTEESTCSTLATRTELFVRGDLDAANGTLDQSFTVDFSMDIKANGNDINSLGDFLVSNQLIADVTVKLKNEFDVFQNNFTQTSDVVDFYQKLNPQLFQVFPVNFSTNVPDVLLEPLDIEELDDNTLNNGAFVDVNSERFNLVVIWSNEAGTIDCSLQNIFDPTGNTKARNIIICESTVVNGQSQMILQWISQAYDVDDYDQLVLNFFAFLVNIQRRPSSGADTESQKVLRSFFTVSFFECCQASNLDELDYFGIFSGIAFMLEGVFAFFVAYAYYGGQVKREEVIEYEKEKEASHVGYGKELYEKKKQEYDENTWDTSKLMRVLFNPRCRAIPFSNLVSFLSLFALLGIAAFAASIYEASETQIVCSPTSQADVGAKSCGSMALTSHVYNSIRSSTGVLLPIGVSAQLDVERTAVSTFSLDQLFQGESYLPKVLNSSCVNQGLADCIRNLDGELQNFGQTRIVEETIDGVVEVSLLFTNITFAAGSQTALTFDITTEVPDPNATNGKFLEVIYELTETRQDTEVVEYRASFVSTFETGPERAVSLQQDGGSIVNNILLTAGTETGAEELIVQRFEDAFVQCCAANKLNYFDYWGLMIGFVALGEGILTFVVAIVVYLCAGRINLPDWEQK